jgi:DNA repair protein RecN (Recombination protein N)
MRKLGSRLMDIHSQHETLQLGDHFFQLRLVDAYAENSTLLDEYDALFDAFSEARRAFENLQSEAENLRQEADYIRFQLDELIKADFKEGEQEELESELKVMEHSEEIKTRFQQILGFLSNSEFSSQTSLREARSHLNHISEYSTHYGALLSRLDSVVIEVEDLIAEIENEDTKVEFDPERIEFVKERLSTLYRLLKKHRAGSLTELLTIQAQLEEKNSITSNVDQALEDARKRFEQSQTKVTQCAAKLTEGRRKAVQPLSKKLLKLLHELGMPEANLLIELTPTSVGPTGADKVEILFTANKGMSLKPLAQVASGGEFARVMFSIKYIMTERTAMPTLILDEIDTGISGEVAMKLGAMMKTMAAKHQVIAISHLPQIAAKGDSHYFVYKDNSAAKTISAIRQLTEKERIEEIAKMIGGANPSRVALQNAQELLAH